MQQVKLVIEFFVQTECGEHLSEMYINLLSSLSCITIFKGQLWAKHKSLATPL